MADYPSSESDQPPEAASHCLSRTRRRQQRALPAFTSLVRQPLLTKSFTLPAGRGHVVGELGLPPQATGLVVIGYGLGTSRLSWRSHYLNRLLQQADLGTFSLDLLTPVEERQQHGASPPLDLLAERLIQGAKWTQQQPGLLGLRLGLMGEYAIGSAALMACPKLGNLVGGVVWMEGQAENQPPSQPAPTLLLVHDQEMASVEANQQVQRTLGTESQIRAVGQTSPWLGEPSLLAQVGQQAAQWFNKYLARPRSR